MRLLFSLLFVSSLYLQAAGGFSHNVAMDPESRDSISVTSPFHNTPTVGFMPIHVVIENRSTEDREWSLTPRGMGIGRDWIAASWNFPVGAGSKAEFDILVPLKFQNFNYRWGAQFNWSGPGVDTPMMQLPQTGNTSNPANIPFHALSDSLHAKHWGTLESEATPPDPFAKKGRAFSLLGTSINLSQAPTDWRAYTGLDQILMTAQEWIALQADSKQALQQAMALGTDLVLTCENEQEADLIRQSFNRSDSNKSWQLGPSQVDLLIDGSSSTARIQNILRKNEGIATLLENHRLSSYLDQTVPPISTAGPLVLIFIVLFGIVAGPINLFVLAPSGRRHRLFITTPIISFLGALILAAAIFIQDGTGGTGTRLLHVQVLPDQKQIVIRQEQASRTGLLFGSSFQTPPSTWVQPLSKDNSGLSGNGSESGLVIDPSGTFFGEWFQSRTRQNQLITSARPSRASIEFTSGTTPSILSTIEVPLAEIYVRDPDGNLWRAKNVQPGTRTNLTREMSGMQGWDDQISRLEFSELMKATTKSHNPSQGSFYAIATDAGSLPVETLSSIRWNTPLVLISGALTLK